MNDDINLKYLNKNDQLSSDNDAFARLWNLAAIGPLELKRIMCYKLYNIYNINTNSHQYLICIILDYI